MLKAATWSERLSIINEISSAPNWDVNCCLFGVDFDFDFVFVFDFDFVFVFDFDFDFLDEESSFESESVSPSEDSNLVGEWLVGSQPSSRGL